MFDGTSRSDGPLPALERASGRLRLRVERGGIAELCQEGCFKLLVPRARPVEAVTLNTAGGLAGGDRLRSEIVVGEGAVATVTSAACEKVYRSTGASASVAAVLSVAEGGRLDWLPQETILFDRARLDRSIEVDLAAGATLLLLEAVVFGRTARGETVEDGFFRDTWRIRRGGKLVHAEAARLDGGIAKTLRRRAVLDGGCAAATVLYAAADTAEFLDPLRAALGAEAGASLRDGVLLARFVAGDSFALRPALLAAMRVLRRNSVPRVWLC